MNCYSTVQSTVSGLMCSSNAIFFSQGPTEAERKIEELTRQLEEEMEKQEEEGEYFGKTLNRSHVTFIRVFRKK